MHRLHPDRSCRRAARIPTAPPGNRPSPKPPDQPRQADLADPEGIDVAPLYSAGSRRPRPPADLPRLTAVPAWPYPTMYVNQPWTIRQYAGFSTAEDSNAFYRRNLAQGQKSLSESPSTSPPTAATTPTTRVAGDVGMAGVAIDSILDMRVLFDGIPLDTMSVSMTMNGAVLRSWPCTSWPPRNKASRPRNSPAPFRTTSSKNHGSQYLHLSSLPSMRIISDIFAYTSDKMPRFNSISISGYHMQEAGATADLELAYTLADGVEYIRAGLAAGMDVDAFAPRLSFFWAIGMNFFMEIAKLRAARLLWSKLVKQFDPQNPEVPVAAHPLADVRLESDRPGRVQQRDPHLRRGDGRDTGHTQSLHTNALDEALALPTDFSARIARNTQLFLQQESGTTNVIDPWGGSYFIERLTRQLAERAWSTSPRSRLGMAKAIEAGIPKLRIEEGGPHPGPHRLRRQAVIGSTSSGRSHRRTSTC